MHYRWIPSEWNPADGQSRNLAVASGLKPLIARSDHASEISGCQSSMAGYGKQQQSQCGERSLDWSEPAFISIGGGIWQKTKRGS
eukprot:1943146-Karenia_brevis.AAC.1